MRNGARLAINCAAFVAALAPARAHDRHFSFAGEPGSAKQVSRVVEVVMTDADGEMAFAPDHLEVERGQSVEFVIRNRGKVSHEFVLGAKSENAAHAAMMTEMHDMKHDDPNAKTVEPGKSSSLVWRFSRKGEFEFACLIPGHYEAGMHGVVVVK